MSEDLKRIEEVLDRQVRPSLRAHGGEIQVDRLENKVLYVKLLGQCAGCPSADLTNETLVEAEVVKALPELVEKVAVIQTVSDELWEQAKRLLRDHHLYRRNAIPTPVYGQKRRTHPCRRDESGAFEQGSFGHLTALLVK